MCSYLGCPVRDKCYRATAKPSDYQSYVTNPSKIVNGKFECDLYWGSPAHLLLVQLKGITGHEKSNKNTDRHNSPP